MDININFRFYESDVSSIETDISTIQSDVNKNETDIAALSGDVSVLRTDVSNNKSDISTLKTDVGTLKTDVSKNKTDIAALQADKADKTNTATRSDLAALESDVKANTLDITTLTGDVANLQNKKLNRIENELNTDAKAVVAAINSINSKLESMLNIYHKGSVTFHYKVATLPPAPIVLLKHAPAGTYKTHGHIETSVTPEAPYDKCCIVLLDVDADVPTIDIINKNDIKGVYNLGDDIVITDHAQVVLYPCDKDYIKSIIPGTVIIDPTYDYDMLVTGLWVSEKFIEESYLSGLISEVGIISNRIGSTTNAELKGMTIGQALDYIMTKINA